MEEAEAKKVESQKNVRMCVEPALLGHASDQVALAAGADAVMVSCFTKIFPLSFA